MNQARFDIINKVKSFFDSIEIDLSHKKLCVCLSGGADSVALLHIMHELSPLYGFTLCACHFNHMIRGEEADRDESFCKELCNTLGIRIYCGRDDVPANARFHKLSLEEAARNCRYAFFKRISDRYYIDYCVTAHNMNDDAETLLFNIIRGAGVNGAASISPKNGTVIRPLLYVKRTEIEAFLSEIEQEYVTDSTNNSTEYTRNYIRKEILPRLESINPSLVEALSRYAESVRTDRDYFEQLITGDTDVDLSSTHKALRIRTYIEKYKRISGKLLNSDMINDIENALKSGHRRVLSLNEDYEAVVDGKNVCFYHKNENVEKEFPVENIHVGKNHLFGDRVTVDLSYEELSDFQNIYKITTTDTLSFDNIVGEIRVRNRRIGDKICIHGINKRLKKLFIDKKIPKEYRHIIPIIFDDKGILYVPFVGIADRAYCKKNTNGIHITTCLDTANTERWKNAYEQK